MCLYVCPTGAANTENSIIDPETCIGCGACAEACPSAAISMVPSKYPPQQPKGDAVIAAQQAYAQSKIEQEQIAAFLSSSSSSASAKLFFEAIRRSNRLMAEDLFRESGFMIPQGLETQALLKEISGDGLPEPQQDAVNFLLNEL